MSEIKVQNGEWVVVCDGKKALILENTGDEKFPNLKTVQAFEHSDAKSRDIGSDAAGRAFASVGSARSAMEETDWHDQEEQRFLHQVLAHLDAALNAGKTRSLIMIAPPRALGVLRQCYSHAVRQALRKELDKDFVKLPVYEIEKHLSAA